MEDSFSFVFYESYFDAIFTIDDYKERSDLLEAIYNYLKSGKITKLSGQVKTCFILMKPILDKSKKENKRAGNPNFKKGKPNPYYHGELLNNNDEIDMVKKSQNNDICNKKDNNYAISNSACNSDSNGNSDSISNNFQIAETHVAENENVYDKNCENLDNNDEKSAIINENNVEKLKNVLKNGEEVESIKDIERRVMGEFASFKQLASKGAKSIKECGPAKADDEKLWQIRDKVPPTLDEVKKYIEDYNLVIDANVFFDYYEARGWMIGKSPMFSYRAALRSWQRNAEENEKKKEREKKFGYQSRVYNKEELDSLFDDLDTVIDKI